MTYLLIALYCSIHNFILQSILVRLNGFVRFKLADIVLLYPLNTWYTKIDCKIKL